MRSRSYDRTRWRSLWRRSREPAKTWRSWWGRFSRMWTTLLVMRWTSEGRPGASSRPVMRLSQNPATPGPWHSGLQGGAAQPLLSAHGDVQHGAAVRYRRWGQTACLPLHIHPVPHLAISAAMASGLAGSEWTCVNIMYTFPVNAPFWMHMTVVLSGLTPGLQSPSTNLSGPAPWVFCSPFVGTRGWRCTGVSGCACSAAPTLTPPPAVLQKRFPQCLPAAHLVRHAEAHLPTPVSW